MVNTFFEKFWLFSFTNPRWAWKRAPGINSSTLLYGILLVTVPSWILRLIFPSANTGYSLAVLGCGVLLNILLRRRAPGILYLYRGVQTIDWHGLRGAYVQVPESEAGFTVGSVLAKQFSWVANFFVLGLFLALLTTPQVLSQGISLELCWILIQTGAFVATVYVLPLVIMFRLLLWVIQPLRYLSSNHA